MLVSGGIPVITNLFLMSKVCDSFATITTPIYSSTKLPTAFKAYYPTKEAAKRKDKRFEIREIFVVVSHGAGMARPIRFGLTGETICRNGSIIYAMDVIYSTVLSMG